MTREVTSHLVGASGWWVLLQIVHIRSPGRSSRVDMRLHLSLVVKQKGFSRAALFLKHHTGQSWGMTPSACHNSRNVLVVSSKGQCLCGWPANMVNLNLSCSTCPGKNKVMGAWWPNQKAALTWWRLYLSESRPRMAAHLVSLDNAPLLAGKIGDVLTEILFKTQSYAKGWKLVEICGHYLQENVRRRERRVTESIWVWSSGLGTSFLIS